MNRAHELSNILTDLYGEVFGGVIDEQYELSWTDLRLLAGGTLPELLLTETTRRLQEIGYTLVPLEETVLVAMESEFAARRVPGRMVQRYLDERVDEVVQIDDDDDVEEEAADDDDVEDDD